MRDAGAIPPPGWEERVTDALRRLSPGAGLWLAAAAIVLVGVADTGVSLVTGADLVLTVLYLFPVSAAAWTSGVGGGLAIAVLGSVVEGLSTWSTSAEARANPLRLVAEDALELAVFVGAVAIVRALRRRLERERLLSRTDDLTGVANRRAFEEAVDLERLRVRRSRAPLSVAFVDLDGFKAVNDRHGHAAGDRLLAAVGAALTAGVRETDLVARLGGDEFGVLLPGAGEEAAHATGERLREAVRLAARAHGAEVGASVGVATFLSAPESCDAVLGAADAAMYEVKRGTKDGVRAVVVGERAAERASGA